MLCVVVTANSAQLHEGLSNQCILLAARNSLVAIVERRLGTCTKRVVPEIDDRDDTSWGDPSSLKLHGARRVTNQALRALLY